MRRLSFLLPILLGSMLSGCIGEPDKPLRLGSILWPGYEPLYMARELGYFDSQNIQLVEHPSSSDVLLSFRNKELEAASITLDEVLLLEQLNIPVAVVLIHDISQGADSIIAKPDIAAVAALKNRRIGVESTALGAYVITRALELNGLPVDDVQIKTVNINMHEQAFMQNEVDAVVTFEPVRTKLLAQGGREVFTSKQLPDEIVDVLVVHRDYIEQHPEVVQQLVEGWFQALAYMKSDRQSALNQMAKRLGLNADQLAASYEGLLLPDQATNKQLLGGENPRLGATVVKLNETMVRAGLLDVRGNPQSLINAKFVEAVK